MKTKDESFNLLAERTDNEDNFDLNGYPKTQKEGDITETDLFVPGLDLGFEQADEDDAENA